MATETDEYERAYWQLLLQQRTQVGRLSIKYFLICSCVLTSMRRKG